MRIDSGPLPPAVAGTCSVARAGLPTALAKLVPTEPAQFMSALELAYLAASADGLDERERHTIATTLENVSGIGFDGDAFAEHFADLDEAVEMFGRRERL